MHSRNNLLLIAALALIACTEREPLPADSVASGGNDAPPVALDGNDAPPAAAGPTTGAPAARTPDTVATLALDGEGLRAFLPPSGAARPIPFGEPRPVVLAAVTRMQGGRAPVLTENRECRLTLARWQVSGLELWFATDSARRFVGWSLGRRAASDSSSSPLTTASGIGLGSTRAALESTYVTHVARSTLGTEFSTGGMAGLLTSERPDAAITNLWAGQVCLAR